MAKRKDGVTEASPASNYSSAIARAVEWLGDRYLLAKPINAASGRLAGGVHISAASQHGPHWRAARPGYAKPSSRP